MTDDHPARTGLSTWARARRSVARIVGPGRRRPAEREEPAVDPGRFDQRCESASRQLDARSPAVRSEGVAVLTALADANPDNRQTCVDVLCDYLRRPVGPGPTQTVDTTLETRHLITTVLADHLRDPHADTSWSQLDFDLRGAWFVDANFATATFAGRETRFDGATFAGKGTTSFEDTAFTSTEVTSFAAATFAGESTSFESATFAHGATVFDEATFGGHSTLFDAAIFAGVRTSFVRTRFASKAVTSFNAATFSGDLGFDQAAFTSDSTWFDEAAFTGKRVRFDNATFTGRQTRFDEATFTSDSTGFDQAAFASWETTSFDSVRFASAATSFKEATFTSEVTRFDRATVDGRHLASDPTTRGILHDMTRAVRFDHYGPLDVLEVVDVEKPTPAPGRVVVEVIATSINPGEIAIREGEKHDVAPATFPSGQGSDLAGRVVAIGDQVDQWAPGEEVIGWTDERAAQAEFVSVPADQLIARPESVPWDQAGSLYVAGGTACGMVDAVPAGSGETAVVFAAAGGVGSFLTQLLIRRGVRVLAVAGPANDEWLRGVGAEPVHHGEGLQQRLHDTAPDGIDAAYDAFGDGYVELALALGVDADRVITIIDFETAERLGVTIVFGYQVTSTGVLAELADLIAAGQLSVPIAAHYPLEKVREAYAELAERRTRGKVVLMVSAD